MSCHDVSEVQRTVALFAEERAPVGWEDDETIVRLKVHELSLHRPRQWGGCWLACHLYQTLGLDAFWAQVLEPSRKGTPWALVLQTLGRIVSWIRAAMAPAPALVPTQRHGRSVGGGFPLGGR